MVGRLSDCFDVVEHDLPGWDSHEHGLPPIKAKGYDLLLSHARDVFQVTECGDSDLGGRPSS